MSNAVSKEQWITLFREIGLNDATMKKWHQVFEARFPEGHQSFLEWLQLPAEDIAKIRAI